MENFSFEMLLKVCDSMTNYDVRSTIGYCLFSGIESEMTDVTYQSLKDLKVFNIVPINDSLIVTVV